MKIPVTVGSTSPPRGAPSSATASVDTKPGIASRRPPLGADAAPAGASCRSSPSVPATPDTRSLSRCSSSQEVILASCSPLHPFRKPRGSDVAGASRPPGLDPDPSCDRRGNVACGAHKTTAKGEARGNEDERDGSGGGGGSSRQHALLLTPRTSRDPQRRGRSRRGTFLVGFIAFPGRCRRSNFAVCRRGLSSQDCVG